MPSSFNFLPRVLCFAMVLAGVLRFSVCGAEEDAPHVLVIHSYSMSTVWTANLQEGLVSGLQRLNAKVALSVEYMDSKRFSVEQVAGPFEALLRAKYVSRRPDVVVVSDNNALEFLVKRRDSLFPGIPVVFVGVNNYQESGAVGQPDMTGIVEDADIAGTLELIRRVDPQLRRVVAVADRVPSALLHLKRFRESVVDLSGQVEAGELVGLNVPRLRAALRNQPDHTAVVLLSYYRTPEGRSLEAPEAARIVSSVGLPVYSMWDIYMGHGIIGGSITSGHVHGGRAAELLVRGLRGESVASIPIVWRSPSVPMFDYRAMVRAGIFVRDLPDRAVVVNEPESLLYRHWGEVFVVAFFIVLQAIAIVALLRNVSRRRAAENALRLSEARFRAITENTSEMTLILDGHGYCTYVSPAVRGIGGREPTEVIGRLANCYVHPEDIDKLEEMVTRLRMVPGETEQLSDFRVRHKDGHFVHLEALFTNMLNVPEIGAIVINCREITERMERERIMRQQALVFDTINDGVIITSPEGRIMHWNRGAEEMFGYSREEAIGQPTFFMRPREDAERLVRSMDEGIARERRWRGEIPFVRKDGTRGICETVVVPLASEGEPDAGRVGVNRDVTQRREAEEQRRRLETKVQQSQKLESLGVLAGGIAHDFNNLLMGILGQADLALMDLAPAASVRRNLVRIEEAAHRAADLSRQMLAYSGRGRFVVERVNLNAVVEESLELLRVSVHEKAVLRVNLSEAGAFVEADASQMRQVVVNLVTNASEAMEDKAGEIVVSTTVRDCKRTDLGDCYLDENLSEGRYVILEVSDTGRGMDADTLPRVFDPFFTTKFTGRGLGLAAVLGIVRGHGGGVRVKSRPERGSRFEVLLPVAGAFESRVEIPDDTPPARAPVACAGTILLVDDEETVLQVGCEMLERGGFHVLTASDGKEALEVFTQHASEIVCVLLDMTMPVMGGEETFRRIRQVDQRVRIVMSSGYNEQEVKKRFSDQSISGFIQKPYRSTDLMLGIQEALASPTGGA